MKMKRVQLYLPDHIIEALREIAADKAKKKGYFYGYTTYIRDILIKEARNEQKKNK